MKTIIFRNAIVLYFTCFILLISNSSLAKKITEIERVVNIDSVSYSGYLSDGSHFYTLLRVSRVNEDICRNNKASLGVFSCNTVRNVVDQIVLKVNGISLNIPDRAYSDLYNVDPSSYFSITQTQNGKIFLNIAGGDGCESYEVKLLFSNNEIVKRTGESHNGPISVIDFSKQ